ncbi:basic salivary proline-rich protein 1 [Corythoichthys intestinalis]|uniref:basic salivary proline-rich protein 1 n=1 Tax=Corythoichthys intestinalis TaxID=161448 RepID=UPI0025A63E93|nr:basic salivary proline-rich protein 1 [Corythoichthys intestinalis]
MASMQDGLNFTAPPYGKVLLLGAIAAASAFVVTILIVALCVGCHRKGKTHNVPSEGGKHRLMDMGILRQSKLRSITKSDTQMNKINCNGKSRQLPQIPSEDGEHTYSEVGRSSSAARTDDALYAAVGRAGQTDTPAPPAVPANTPAPPDPDGDAEGSPTEAQAAAAPRPPETAEYACVRKPRKADKAPQKRDSGTDTADPPQPRHPPPSHPAPPPPQHPHSTKLPRRNLDAFNVPSFPKEVMFMGNGEQYIWKPPEDEDVLALHSKAPGPVGMHAMDNVQPSAAVVAEMYSKVCKKKRGAPGSPPPSNPGFRTLGRDRDGGFSVVVKPQTWALREGRPPADRRRYESFGTAAAEEEEGEVEPPYADPEGGPGGWRRAANSCGATLRPRRKKSQQRQPPPPPPPKLRHLPLPGGDGLYESIGELERGSGTTTVFTFNDGMEMYVTGL